MEDHQQEQPSEGRASGPFPKSDQPEQPAENNQAEKGALPGTTGELIHNAPVVIFAIVGIILAAILQLFLGLFPFRILIPLGAILAPTTVLGWQYKHRYYEAFRWTAASYAVGIIVGCIVISATRFPSLPDSFSSIPATINPTSEISPQIGFSCPTLDDNFTKFPLITKDKVSALSELRQMVMQVRVLAVTISGDGRLLAAANAKGVCLYDTETRQGYFKSLPLGVSAAAFSLDGSLVAIGEENGTVSLGVLDIQRRSMEERWKIPKHKAPVTSLAFSPKSRWLISASDDGTILRWDTLNGDNNDVLDKQSAPVKVVTFSTNGTLASGAGDGVVKLWDIDNLTEVISMTGGISSITHLTFSPKERDHLASSSGKIISLWNIANGEEIRQFQGHNGPVLGIAFSPDGRLLASASEDKTIRVWEVDTSKELTRLEGHKDMVYGVIFNKEGNLLISGGDDTIRLWGITELK